MAWCLIPFISVSFLGGGGLSGPGLAPDSEKSSLLLFPSFPKGEASLNVSHAPRHQGHPNQFGERPVFLTYSDREGSSAGVWGELCGEQR